MSSFKKIVLENYFPEEDRSVSREKDDTRRPRLTLRHLNKLRKIREMRRLEMAAHKEFVQTMYGPQEDEGGDMPGF
jgi:hypothetical protein